MPPRGPRQPALPQLLKDKIYKTGQTRGADDDEIFQNRVLRNNTVLIPYLQWDQYGRPPEGQEEFEKGYIVLIPPVHYFGTEDIESELRSRGLVVGENAVVFYERRADWNANCPDDLRWQAAQSRQAPLGGQYVARVAATTAAEGGGKIGRGFVTTSPKGAGIRLYEYATAETIAHCRLQLEALFWRCVDSQGVVLQNGMTAEQAAEREEFCIRACEAEQLLNMQRLKEARLVNGDGVTICPFCLEPLSGKGFFSRLEQAEGRAVHDLTVTEVNLFHIQELRYGVYNHRPYNLGWGHHHCNVVVKDSGIQRTLVWMTEVIERNVEAGYLSAKVNPS